MIQENIIKRYPNRREFLNHICMGGAALTLSGCMNGWGKFAGGSAKKKPNFVFILIDDMGWMDAGCYGSEFYETPHIDRLASEGMRFTNGYAACPVCSPTRASIMTGKHPARLNLTEWIGGSRKGKLLGAEYERQLPLEEVTIAEALQAAGYKTFFAGKWHLGDELYYPEHQGFDINKGGWSKGAPTYDIEKFRGGYFTPYENPRLTDGPEGEYLTDRLTDESIAFLEGHGEEPFLLYLSHYAVHNPQQAKAEHIEKYQAKAATLPPAEEPEFLPEGERRARQIQNQPVYAAMMHSVDESVGRVMAKLEEMGIAENTVVIFMSDNGGLSTSEGSPTSNVPLRAGKGWLYEGGIREPMIIRWLGVTEPGSTCSEPVTSHDFYPTMLEMAGLPLMPEQHIDGVSLSPLLHQKGKPNRKAIYWHYPHYSNQGGKPGAAVRAGDYKLIEWFETGQIELYNLSKDLSETNNLTEQMPKKAAELKQMLHDWRRQVDARMPRPNPDWKDK
ncbi:sulfatase [Planctomycetota bacterium]